MIIAVGIAAAVLLLIFEWRRRDRRQRFARVVASVLAVGALVAWRLQPAATDETPPRAAAAAVLVMQGADASAQLPHVVSATSRFILADAGPVGGDTALVPDVGFLRRRYPEINRLRIIGDGLEPYELELLGGVAVTYEPTEALAKTPAISALSAPREVSLGEAIAIRGRVDGLRSDERVRVAVEAPDGLEISVIVGSTGDTTFALSPASPAAEGQFVWRVKLLRDDDQRTVLAEETLGIAVRAARLPRALVLESSPNLDTTHLQRWYAEHGGAFNARTLVGAARYRFAAAEFAQVDAGLLADFDVVIADARALTALQPDEKRALRAAVAEAGLGMLILPRGELTLPNEFAAWRIAPAAAESESERRSARLVWRGLAAPVETPVAIENAAIEMQTSRRALVIDSRGAPVVDAVRRGRGEIALSLVRDTWQWRLQNQSVTFARYWSFVLGRLAKAQAAEGWGIANAPGAPLLVNQPVELEYLSTAELPKPGEVRAAGDDHAVAVPLAQDLAEPQRWRTTFWPREAGWHHVVAPESGARLDFFVHGGDEWANVRAENRRAATERFAALSKEAPRAASDDETRGVTTAGGWACFAVFLLSSSYLWYERRNATRW
jgi:hypothetical protein